MGTVVGSLSYFKDGGNPLTSITKKSRGGSQ